MDIPDHLRAPLKVLRKACMAETGVELTYLEQSKNGYIPDVPELKCYINCMLEHSGMIDDDGKIHFKDVWHLLTASMKETVEYVTSECETIRN